jgi:prepilin-type N-terminal cleavage/methylation domain-containing protein
MKRAIFSRQVSPSWRFRGFTLVELLVVISIIALLAGLLLPVIVGSIKKAEIHKALGEVTAIAMAVEHFQVEYSKYPGQNAATVDHPYSGTDYQNLIATLTGSNIVNWNGILNSNPRGTTFLSVDQRSVVTNAAGAGGTAVKGDLADPWGNRYEVVADWNFDNKIDNPANIADGGNAYNHGVVAWSYGPRAVATQNATDGTHIRSWK